MSEITWEELEPKVRELAEKNPDFVYPDIPGGCLYLADDRQPGCIFGQALTGLGVEIPASYEGLDIRMVLNNLNVEYTKQQGMWAMVVQRSQDAEVPWRASVAKADRLYPLSEDGDA